MVCLVGLQTAKSVTRLSSEFSLKFLDCHIRVYHAAVGLLDSRVDVVLELNSGGLVALAMFDGLHLSLTKLFINY